MRSNRRIGPMRFCNAWGQWLLLMGAMTCTVTALPTSGETHSHQQLRLRSRGENEGRRQLEAPWQVMQAEDTVVTVVRPHGVKQEITVRNAAAVATRQGGDPAEVVVGIKFLVSSTSDSETDPNVDIADLEKTLEVFATTLVQEWAYRKLQVLSSSDAIRQLGNLRGLPSNTNSAAADYHHHHKSTASGGLNHRRLQLSLVPGTAEVSETLLPSTECISSASQGDGFPHCNEAHGVFNVMAEAGTEARVCRNMETSIKNLNDDDYLNTALELAVDDATGLVLSQASTDFCMPIEVYEEDQQAATADNNNQVDGNSSAASTSAPTNATPGATTDDDSQPNATDPPPGENDTAPAPTALPADASSTTAPAPAPDTEPAAEATTPAPEPATTDAPNNGNGTATETEAPTEEEFVDEWLTLLEGEKEGGDGDGGDSWLDTVDAATNPADDDASKPATPAPAPPDNSDVTADIAKQREEYWDDALLDRVIFILMLVWGSCFVSVCCLYWGDAAWIRYRQEQLYTANEYHFHDGRWYYDEKHKFPRDDYVDKPAPGSELNPLSEEMELSSEEEDEEDSMYMSDSEESDDDFDFEEDDDWSDDDNDESGDFYVDYDEEDENEDVFDESDGESMDAFNESSDFFDDEEDQEQAKPKKRHK